MSLRQLQLKFKEAIKGSKVQFRDVEGFLETYQYAFWARIEESLLEDFPLLKRKLGKTKLRKLLKAYWDTGAAGKLGLAEAGFGLPKFLSKQPRLKILAEKDILKIRSYQRGEKVSPEFRNLSTFDPQSSAKVCWVLHPSLVWDHKFLACTTCGETKLYPISREERFLLEILSKEPELTQLTRFLEKKKISSSKVESAFKKFTQKGWIHGFKIAQ